MKKYIAVDLGASNGRVVVGDLENIEVMNRFSSKSVVVNGTMRWDILAIYSEILEGIKKAFRLYGDQIGGIGIDTWGVDHAFLDKHDHLIGNPYHYRDDRTDGQMEKLFKKISQKEIYDETGIQFMQLNTIFQMCAAVEEMPEMLSSAETYLSIPDLLNFWLCGVKKNEYTHASTTQLLNAEERTWSGKILDEVGVKQSLFQEVVSSGTVLGPLRDDVAREVGAPDGVSVIAIGSHDTASAVAAVPVSDGEECLYLSSGTWSLLGIESENPIINDESFDNNFTNEGGVTGNIRFLKNIIGMWILQESRRYWKETGEDMDDFDKLMNAAVESTTESIIDPNSSEFLKPGTREDNMPLRIYKYCEKTGQKTPESIGDYVRIIYQGLAQAYTDVIKTLEVMSGKKFTTLYIIGGGCRDELLNRMTAEKSGLTVCAGPAEATALGNIMVQAVASGDIGSIAEGRKILRDKTDLKEYLPSK